MAAITPDDCTKKRTWLRFEPTISVGNIVTIGAVAVSIFVWGSTVERTLAVHGVQIQNTQQTGLRLAAEIALNKTEINESLKEINTELKEISAQISVFLLQRK